MKQLVLASSNPGKLREFAALLEPAGIEVIPQSQFSITDADEPHGTFVENALAKARHASRWSKLPALADDSGICVRALNGAPGVRSARFTENAAGRNMGRQIPDRQTQDQLNNEKLIALLAGQHDRRAHYTCVIVLLRHAEDPEPLIASGAWHGEIVAVPRGSSGFGYDPHFLLPELGLTSAELEPAQKNAISHRGKAMRRLLAALKADNT